MDESTQNVEQETEQDLQEQEKAQWLDCLDEGEVEEVGSVPTLPQDYQLADTDADSDNLDAPLLADFREFALKEGVPQGEFSRVVSFTLSNFADEKEAQASFGEFCQKNRIGRKRAEKYVDFYLRAKKAHSKRIVKTMERSGCDENQALTVDAITRRPSFVDGQHKSHSKTMKDFHKALGNRGKK